jgi:hypothetical protein
LPLAKQASRSRTLGEQHLMAFIREDLRKELADTDFVVYD